MPSPVRTTTLNGRRWDDRWVALECLKSIVLIPQRVKDALNKPTQVDQHIDPILQGAALSRPLGWGSAPRTMSQLLS